MNHDAKIMAYRRKGSKVPTLQPQWDVSAAQLFAAFRPQHRPYRRPSGANRDWAFKP
jgi:hypothetical protein